MRDPKGPAVCAENEARQRYSCHMSRVFPQLLAAFRRGRWGMCSKEERGRGTVWSASDLKDQVPFAHPAMQLWSSPGTDLLGLPLVELPGRCERGAQKEQEQNWATALAVTKLRWLGQNLLSPSERGPWWEKLGMLFCITGFFSCSQDGQSAVTYQQQNL